MEIRNTRKEKDKEEAKKYSQDKSSFGQLKTIVLKDEDPVTRYWARESHRFKRYYPDDKEIDVEEKNKFQIAIKKYKSKGLSNNLLNKKLFSKKIQDKLKRFKSLDKQEKGTLQQEIRDELKLDNIIPNEPLHPAKTKINREKQEGGRNHG